MNSITNDGCGTKHNSLVTDLTLKTNQSLTYPGTDLGKGVDSITLPGSYRSPNVVNKSSEASFVDHLSLTPLEVMVIKQLVK